MKTDNTKTKPERMDSSALLGAGFYVIEERSRRQDKTLAPWKLVCAFAESQRDSAYNFYGKFHQNTHARILKPNGGTES